MHFRKNNCDFRRKDALREASSEVMTNMEVVKAIQVINGKNLA